MNINTFKKFNNAISRSSKDTIEQTLTDCMEFAAFQICEHRNATPYAIVIASMSQIAGKPKGFTRKNLIEFIQSIGLEFDKSKNVVSVPKAFQKVMTDFGDFKWWVIFQDAIPEKTPSAKFQQAVKSAESNGLTLQQMLDVVGAQFAVELNVPTIDEAIAEAIAA